MCSSVGYRHKSGMTWSGETSRNRRIFARRGYRSGGRRTTMLCIMFADALPTDSTPHNQPGGFVALQNEQAKSPIDALAASQAADRQHRKWRRARGVTGIGGLMLFVSFFLPAVSSCSTPDSPVELFLSMAENPGEIITPEGIHMLLVCSAAYLLGLVIAISCLVAVFKPFSHGDPTGHYWSALVCSMIAVAVAWLPVWLLNSATRGPWGRNPNVALSWDEYLEIWRHWEWYWFLLGILQLVFSIRSKDGKDLCVVWGGSISLMIWFSVWFIDMKSHYGLWLSMAGSALIFGGLTYEAMLLGRRGLVETLGRLLIGRLKYDRRDEIRCECGYLLIGLPEPRCPECGLSFEPKRESVG